MRDFIIENLNSSDTLSTAVILLNNLVAMAVSFFLMFVYRITYSGTAYSKKFNVSLGAMTLITSMIMSIICNNVALSLGMVGALSIIRFRTAVKDIRDAVFIFWSIAVGIGCGVSQYLLVGIGSLFLLCFFLLTKSAVMANRLLLVISGSITAKNQIASSVEEHFQGKAHLCTQNASQKNCEFIYSVGEKELSNANTKNMIDIVERLMKIDGIERVNLIEQQDELAR